jgi:hypothetical protein
MTAAADVSPVVSPNAGRLGAPLLSLAARVLRDVRPADAPEAMTALRAFTQAPTPARYLAATYALNAAERRHKLRQLGRAVGNRRTEEALDMLARGDACAPELLDALRSLPPDARNGRRLTLISDLLAAHGVIAARAAGALRELQRSLGPLPRRSPPDRNGPERRRQRRRASGQVTK